VLKDAPLDFPDAEHASARLLEQGVHPLRYLVVSGGGHGRLSATAEMAGEDACGTTFFSRGGSVRRSASGAYPHVRAGEAGWFFVDAMYGINKQR